MIELVDLKRQYKSIKPQIDAAIQAVVDSQHFILGDAVKQFEKEFAEAHEVQYCLGCSNGTSAIKLALRALGIGPGDEVITVPNTFIATVEPIIEIGAKPVFVDVLADTYLMDPSKIAAAITTKTKAILPVHLYGQMARMDEIHAIAAKHKLFVIEDAAQAHLSTYKGKYAGQYSDIATFSFYPGKNLGAYGDAGAAVTNNKELYDKMYLLRNHGRSPGAKYEHGAFGVNERMDDIQAAVLSVKLKHLAAWTQKRRELARLYTEKLKGVCVTPAIGSGAEPVWHLYVVQVENRDALFEKLKQQGIEVGIHYPIPLHLQPALKYLGYKQGDFPVAEHAANRIISLPIFAELTSEEQQQVVHTLKEAML